eukprot:14858095-Alexandrium_andersonii.AAC.1
MVSKVQSTIHPRPASVAIRLNAQSTLRNVQHRLRPPELELRRPRNGLEIGLRSSRGVRSAPLFAQILDLPTNTGLEGASSRESAPKRTPIRNPPLRNPRSPRLLAREKPRKNACRANGFRGRRPPETEPRPVKPVSTPLP